MSPIPHGYCLVLSYLTLMIRKGKSMNGSWVMLCLLDTVLALKPKKTGGGFVVLSSSLCLVEEKDENNFLREFFFFCRHQRDRWSFLRSQDFSGSAFYHLSRDCSSFHVLEDETDYSFTLSNNAYSRPSRLCFGWVHVLDFIRPSARCSQHSLLLKR